MAKDSRKLVQFPRGLTFALITACGADLPTQFSPGSEKADLLRSTATCTPPVQLNLGPSGAVSTWADVSDGNMALVSSRSTGDSILLLELGANGFPEVSDLTHLVATFPNRVVFKVILAYELLAWVVSQGNGLEYWIMSLGPDRTFATSDDRAPVLLAAGYSVWDIVPNEKSLRSGYLAWYDNATNEVVSCDAHDFVRPDSCWVPSALPVRQNVNREALITRMVSHRIYEDTPQNAAGGYDWRRGTGVLWFVAGTQFRPLAALADYFFVGVSTPTPASVQVRDPFGTVLLDFPSNVNAGLYEVAIPKNLASNSVPLAWVDVQNRLTIVGATSRRMVVAPVTGLTQISIDRDLVVYVDSRNLFAQACPNL